MVDKVIPQGNAGIAAFESDGYKTIPLITGDQEIVTTSEVVASGAISGGDLPAYSVVGRSSGELVLANLTGPIAPIGVTTSVVKQGATNRNVTIFRTGTFNPAALNWHADYNTDEKKRLAFEGKCNIHIVKAANAVATGN